MKPHALGGGPSEDELRRMYDDNYSDSDVARLYGVRRQTATYWRLKHGIAAPGPGISRKPRRPRVSHKDLIPWRVKVAHLNDPVRKRLELVSLMRQGVPLAADQEARAKEFLKFLRSNQVVVTYDPDHTDAEGDPAPFYFVPCDGKRDKRGALIRRPT